MRTRDITEGPVLNKSCASVTFFLSWHVKSMQLSVGERERFQDKDGSSVLFVLSALHQVQCSLIKGALGIVKNKELDAAIL